jgi:outer membrane protein
MIPSITLRSTAAARPALVALLSCLPWTPVAAAEPTLSGDLGAGAVYSRAQIRGERDRTDALPYLNAEYASAFARIDTFGLKTLPIGVGHLELVGQVRGDGYEAAGIQTRQDSLPLGLGTLQITPVGAFNVQALHDFGKSGGNLLQARYLAELTWGRMSLYPELGLEFQSRAYTRYYHGTTAGDAANLGRAYQPSSALNPYIGAMVETRLAPHWYINGYVRRSFTDDTIAASPLVSRRPRDSALLALAYRY